MRALKRTNVSSDPKGAELLINRVLQFIPSLQHGVEFLNIILLILYPVHDIKNEWRKIPFLNGAII